MNNPCLELSEGFKELPNEYLCSTTITANAEHLFDSTSESGSNYLKCEESFKIPLVPPPKQCTSSQTSLSVSSSGDVPLESPSQVDSSTLVEKSEMPEMNIEEWYRSTQVILSKASYGTTPTKTEIFINMANEIVEEYQKSKEIEEREVIQMQEMIRSNAERAIEQINTKWVTDCSRREEELSRNLEYIQNNLEKAQLVEVELRQFTDGMRDMMRQMQEQL